MVASFCLDWSRDESKIFQMKSLSAMTLQGQRRDPRQREELPTNAKRRPKLAIYVKDTPEAGCCWYLRAAAAPVSEVGYEQGAGTIPKDIRTGWVQPEENGLALEADAARNDSADLSVQRLFGILGSPPRSVKLEEIDNIIQQAVAEKYR